MYRSFFVHRDAFVIGYPCRPSAQKTSLKFTTVLRRSHRSRSNDVRQYSTAESELPRFEWRRTSQQNIILHIHCFCPGNFVWQDRQLTVLSILDHSCFGLDIIPNRPHLATVPIRYQLRKDHQASTLDRSELVVHRQLETFERVPHKYCILQAQIDE
jgi:hypothetical protein